MKTNDSNVMEFLDEITTQMTELVFNEPYREIKSDLDNHIRFIFTDEAQDFYNERYDEVETLFTNLILNPAKDGKQ
jgi:hypothetical protein